MKTIIVPFVLLVLSACASAPRVGDVERLFDDAAFGPRPQLPDAKQVFAVSESMRAYLRSDFEQVSRSGGPRSGLYQALRSQLKLDYDTERTRTAAEAFDARAGNCLSLVILSGALARELGVPVVYQSVRGYDTWSRSGGIAFLSGHVNLALGAPVASDYFSHVIADRPLVIDFVEDANQTDRRARPISESTVLAMFMNNRAAEALVDGKIDEAYWWVRAAVDADPVFLSPYNTLAVVYQRHGNLRAARRVLDYALEREPENTQMLSNLANVLARDGRVEEAQLIERKLVAASKYPPFYFLDLGQQALAAGDVERALGLFEKELKRIPYDHELHFAIALAKLRHGELKEAREHMTLAMENSTRRDQRDIYAAKLNRLEAAVH